MSEALIDELLDLTATEKGYGAALFAANEDNCSSSGLCTSIVLCCDLSHICWSIE